MVSHIAPEQKSRKQKSSPNPQVSSLKCPPSFSRRHHGTVLPKSMANQPRRYLGVCVSNIGPDEFSSKCCLPFLFWKFCLCRWLRPGIERHHNNSQWQGDFPTAEKKVNRKGRNLKNRKCRRYHSNLRLSLQSFFPKFLQTSKTHGIS